MKIRKNDFKFRVLPITFENFKFKLKMELKFLMMPLMRFKMNIRMEEKRQANRRWDGKGRIMPSISWIDVDVELCRDVRMWDGKKG